MTTSLIALTLAASMSVPPAARVSTAGHPATPSLSVQAARLAVAAADAPSQAAAPRDSLRNGAIMGAAIGAGAMLVQGARTCREGACAPEVLLWASLAAGLGAAIGAGIDALFAKAE